MRRSASPKLGAYAALAAAGFLLALVLGRAELVALAGPFAVFLAVGLALSPAPELRVGLRLDEERALEGDVLAGELELTASGPLERVDVALLVPSGLELEPGLPLALRLEGGERHSLPFRLSCRRWGAYALGELVLRAHDRFGLFVHATRVDSRLPLRVYPRPERLQALVRPFESQPYAGNEVARAKGEGIEFADIRPFVYGDRVRRINWRASARRQALYVNESHPERNTDVVLFLDSFAEAREEAGGTLDVAVRGAASLAAAYLEKRDRVGLVSFGGVVRWLTPAMGVTQLYRIIDSLLETEITVSFAWKEIDVLPARTLPPQALVIALSPLLDERSVRALLDLRARGFDLVVVDVSPVPFARPAGDELGELAHRFWRLWRDALHFRYERVGVPVVDWRDDVALASALGEVTAFRRYARRVPA